MKFTFTPTISAAVGDEIWIEFAVHNDKYTVYPVDLGATSFTLSTLSSQLDCRETGTNHLI